MFVPEILVPGSKSHTIRALIIAALAEGESRIIGPLRSGDTLSARNMMAQFGAVIWESQDNNGDTIWHVRGIPGFAEVSSIEVNVGNSGTSLYLGSAVAALFSRPVRFDGDASIRARSAKNLLQALQELGAELRTPQNEGRDYCCPYTLCGPIRSAKIRLCAPTSQYLSALLLVLPLLKGDAKASSEIYLDLLNEHPYIDMTLGWLRQQGIQWQNSGYDWYRIPGNQRYRPFEQRIPADFSSAGFLLCAAAITGARIRLRGLCPNDSQGDARILDFLREMGCSYAWQQQNGQKTGTSYTLEFSGPDGAVLQGGEFDLSQTPDALPAMAVACACAAGKSRLYNVAHARNKECDRIAAMAAELQALGFAVCEQPDGLAFEDGEGGKENFARNRRAQRQTRGYGDHRIIMALSLLKLLQPLQPLELDDCANAAITYPNFFADLAQLFGNTREK